MSDLRFETFRMPGVDVGPENTLPPLSRGSNRRVDKAKYTGFGDEMLEQMAYGHQDNYIPYTMRTGTQASGTSVISTWPSWRTTR